MAQMRLEFWQTTLKENLLDDRLHPPRELTHDILTVKEDLLFYTNLYDTSIGKIPKAYRGVLAPSEKSWRCSTTEHEEANLIFFLMNLKNPQEFHSVSLFATL